MKLISPTRVFLLLSTLILGWAKASEATFGDYSRVLRRWGVDDGLTSGRVDGITQAPDGILWIATERGLFRFDGRTFHRYATEEMEGIEDQRIQHVIADNEGVIWIRTRSGKMGRLEGDQFVRVPLPSGQLYRASWVPHPDGGLLAYVRGGQGNFLVRLWEDDLKILSVSFPDNVQNLYLMTNGKVLLGRSRDTSLEWSNGALKELPLRDIGRYLRRSNGSLIALGSQAIYENQNDRWVEVLKYAKPMRVLPGYAMEDEEGRVWFGNRDPDHLVWEGTDKITRLRVGRDSIPGVIQSAICDADGDLWFATFSGLYQTRYSPFVTWTPPEGMPTDRIVGVRARPDGTIWFYGFGGGGRLLPSETSPSFEFARPSSQLFSIDAGPDGVIWSQIPQGVFRTEGDSAKQVPGPDGRRLSGESIVVDDQGVAWVADGRIYRCDPSQSPLEFLPVSEEELPGSSRSNLRLLPDRSLLAVALGSGVFRKEAGGKNWSQISPPDDETAKSLWLVDVNETSGLWGITRKQELYGWVDGVSIKTSLQEIGLGKVEVIGLALDDIGGIWMTTRSHGVLTLRCDALKEFAEGKADPPLIETFDQASGLGSMGGSFKMEGIARDPEGRIWVATDGGVSAIQPAQWVEERLRAKVPKVRIGQITTDGEHHPSGEKIILPSDNLRLEIGFAAVTFAFPSEIKYRYRLRGIDDYWTEVDAGETALFRALNPGEYLFEVKASSRFGDWDEESTTMLITVLPSWWQRPEIQIGLAIAILALAAGFYRLRMNVYRKEQQAQAAFSRQLIDTQEKERKRMAGELHDGLGQQLLLIKNSTEFARSKLEKDFPLNSRLEEITEIASDALAEVRTITGDLRPTALDRFGLRVAVQSMAEKLAEHGRIKVTHDLVDLEQAWDETTQIAIYRFVQESLNNALKHAEASEVSINTEARKHDLNIEVQDNGIGFDLQTVRQNRSGHGLGLTALEERAKLIGAEIQIRSLAGSGTTIQISIPLPAA